VGGDPYETIKSNREVLAGPKEEELDGAKHWFDISVDDKKYRVSVELNKCVVTTLKTRKKAN
jgi:hypothetical protein